MELSISLATQQKIDAQLATGKFSHAEDVINEALDLYAEHQATLTDLEKSLNDIEAGRLRPLGEVADEVRSARAM